ncbi:hypothetical protein [Streptomyces sp. NPDC001999]
MGGDMTAAVTTMAKERGGPRRLPHPPSADRASEVYGPCVVALRRNGQQGRQPCVEVPAHVGEVGRVGPVPSVDGRDQTAGCAAREEEELTPRLLRLAGIRERAVKSPLHPV